MWAYAVIEAMSYQHEAYWSDYDNQYKVKPRGPLGWLEADPAYQKKLAAEQRYAQLMDSYPTQLAPPNPDLRLLLEEELHG